MSLAVTQAYLTAGSKLLSPDSAQSSSTSPWISPLHQWHFIILQGHPAVPEITCSCGSKLTDLTSSSTHSVLSSLLLATDFYFFGYHFFKSYIFFIFPTLDSSFILSLSSQSCHFLPFPSLLSVACPDSFEQKLPFPFCVGTLKPISPFSGDLVASWLLTRATTEFIIQTGTLLSVKEGAVKYANNRHKRRRSETEFYGCHVVCKHLTYCTAEISSFSVMRCVCVFTWSTVSDGMVSWVTCSAHLWLCPKSAKCLLQKVSSLDAVTFMIIATEVAVQITTPVASFPFHLFLTQVSFLPPLSSPHQYFSLIWLYVLGCSHWHPRQHSPGHLPSQEPEPGW